MGINRTGNDELAAKDAMDAESYFTPAWQESRSGVKAEQVIQIAREFAQNAAENEGRSMVIMGGGVNHWFNADMNYRNIINMLMLCGCVGMTGGGWAHYVGQEKLRPQEGWANITFANDWEKVVPVKCKVLLGITLQLINGVMKKLIIKLKSHPFGRVNTLTYIMLIITKWQFV